MGIGADMTSNFSADSRGSRQAFCMMNDLVTVAKKKPKNGKEK
jgi:hypothetical protein